MMLVICLYGITRLKSPGVAQVKVGFIMLDLILSGVDLLPSSKYQKRCTRIHPQSLFANIAICCPYWIGSLNGSVNFSLTS